MRTEIVTKEMREQLLDTYADFLPDEELVVVTFNHKFDDIVLAPGQDKDYKISYWDKNNQEKYICLAAMNEIDAEDRFNGMFPGNIFISAKEIQI